jgi:hypothetical protein
MAQKSLFKKNKKSAPKAVAANRHGKGAVTKKGKLNKPPKKASLVKAFEESKEISAAINARNLKLSSSKVAATGRRLHTITTRSDNKGKAGDADS